MIQLFDPLVGQWTLCFEAKHSFFKQVVRHTSCFKNLPFTLATTHQMMITYHLSSPCLSKSDVEVSAVTTPPVDLLTVEMALAIREKFSDTPEVDLAQCVTTRGITHRKGMIVAHGATGGWPEFSEIDQICILNESILHCPRALWMVQRAL